MHKPEADTTLGTRLRLHTIRPNILFTTLSSCRPRRRHCAPHIRFLLLNSEHIFNASQLFSPMRKGTAIKWINKSKWEMGREEKKYKASSICSAVDSIFYFRQRLILSAISTFYYILFFYWIIPAAAAAAAARKKRELNCSWIFPI